MRKVHFTELRNLTQLLMDGNRRRINNLPKRLHSSRICIFPPELFIRNLFTSCDGANEKIIYCIWRALFCPRFGQRWCFYKSISKHTTRQTSIWISMQHRIEWWSGHWAVSVRRKQMLTLFFSARSWSPLKISLFITPTGERLDEADDDEFMERFRDGFGQTCS